MYLFRPIYYKFILTKTASEEVGGLWRLECGSMESSTEVSFQLCSTSEISEVEGVELSSCSLADSSFFFLK
jgi:hypothetical protein